MASNPGSVSASFRQSSETRCGRIVLRMREISERSRRLYAPSRSDIPGKIGFGLIESPPALVVGSRSLIKRLSGACRLISFKRSRWRGPSRRIHLGLKTRTQSTAVSLVCSSGASLANDTVMHAAN